jgi:hypothetical protein
VAFLKRFSFLILSCATLAAIGNDNLIPLSAKVLKKGDLQRGLLLASTFDRTAKDLAVLYRLAWISRLHGVSDLSRRDELSTTEQNEGSETLMWKQSSEVWRDEWDAYEAMDALRGTEEPFLASDEEQSVIEALVSPYRKNEEPKNRALSRAILTSSFNQWLAGKETSLENVDDVCQQKALATQTDSTNEKLKSWLNECGTCAGLFCSVAKLKAADGLTAEGQYETALNHYLALGTEFEKTPVAIHYRIVTTQLLARKPLENILRASTPVFEDESNVVPLGQKDAVRSELCETLAAQSSGEIQRLFKTVYTSNAWIRQVRSWIGTCSATQSRKIARVGLQISVKPLEKNLLASAIKTRELREKREVKNQTLQLSRSLANGVKTRVRALSETLDIPLLFPFPEVKFQKAPYHFLKDFNEEAMAHYEAKK